MPGSTCSRLGKQASGAQILQCTAACSKTLPAHATCVHPGMSVHPNPVPDLLDHADSVCDLHFPVELKSGTQEPGAWPLRMVEVVPCLPQGLPAHHGWCSAECPWCPAQLPSTTCVPPCTLRSHKHGVLPLQVVQVVPGLPHGFPAHHDAVVGVQQHAPGPQRSCEAVALLVVRDQAPILIVPAPTS